MLGGLQIRCLILLWIVTFVVGYNTVYCGQLFVRLMWSIALPISWHLHMYNILTYDVLFPGTEVELPASIILLVAQV